jgi:hypothetical protein
MTWLWISMSIDLHTVWIPDVWRAILDGVPFYGHVRTFFFIFPPSEKTNGPTAFQYFPVSIVSILFYFLYIFFSFFYFFLGVLGMTSLSGTFRFHSARADCHHHTHSPSTLLSIFSFLFYLMARFNRNHSILWSDMMLYTGRKSPA